MKQCPASPLKHRPAFGEECGATLRLAVPLVFGQLAQMLIGVVDTVMIGRVGTVPLAAAAFANSLLMVPLVFGVGLLSSVSMQTARAGGAGDHRTAQATLRNGVGVALVLGLLCTIGFALLLPWLAVFGQPAEVVAATPVYLFTCAVSLVPALVGMALKNQADALNARALQGVHHLDHAFVFDSPVGADHHGGIARLTGIGDGRLDGTSDVVQGLRTGVAVAHQFNAFVLLDHHLHHFVGLLGGFADAG